MLQCGLVLSNFAFAILNYPNLNLLLERVKGIEPSYAAWEAAVLPLNYTRAGALFTRVACDREGADAVMPWRGRCAARRLLERLGNPLEQCVAVLARALVKNRAVDDQLVDACALQQFGQLATNRLNVSDQAA